MDNDPDVVDGPSGTVGAVVLTGVLGEGKLVPAEVPGERKVVAAELGAAERVADEDGGG